MTYAALVLTRNAEDGLTGEALVSAGFSVIEMSPDESDAFVNQVNTQAPLVLSVDADISRDELTSILTAIEGHGTQLFLLGDESQQASFTSDVVAGRAMYIRRPLDKNYLIELFRDIYQDAEAAARRGRRKQQAAAMDQFGSLYGSSPPMRAMYRFLRKAAASEAVLCIHGESGTGKELVAEAVHAYSVHSDAPFEAINCAAIPADLVESELFGHEKGSFSGAVAEHIGIFERVGRGTILLDEITEMPHAMQVKLLRVLESGRFRRVGGEVDRNYQARVLAATNRNPLEAIRQGKLREDLYYRISQLEVRVPALRERGQDIVELSRLFVARFDQENDRCFRLSKAAEQALFRHDWPGNVRQLWNVIQKACTTARDRIEIDDLPLEQNTGLPDQPKQADGITLPADCSLQEAERIMIRGYLENYSGDKHRTAKALGISLRTLYARLERYRYGVTESAS